MKRLPHTLACGKVAARRQSVGKPGFIIMEQRDLEEYLEVAQ